MDPNKFQCNNKKKYLHPFYDCNDRRLVKNYTRDDIHLYHQPFMAQKNRYRLSPDFVPFFNQMYGYQKFPCLRPYGCEMDTFEPQNYNMYMDKWLYNY